MLMRRSAWRLRSLVLPALCVLALAGSLKAEVWHVNAAATVGGTGTNWEGAFSDLQDALALAQAGDEIWVAKGVYKADGRTGDRGATYQLVDGVAVYGGFAGWETQRGQRDWVKNETVLSGDLNGDDGPPDCQEHSNCCVGRDTRGCDDAECAQIVCAVSPICCEPFMGNEPVWTESCAEVARRSCCHLGNWRTCDNTYHVVTAIGVSAETVLDGFTVERAYAAVERDLESGVGLLCGAANPIVANCVFRKNAVFGIVSHDGSELTLIGSAVTDTFGDGLRNLGSAPYLMNCRFVRNRWSGVSSQGDPTLIDCEFRENGLGFGSRGDAVLTNCTFIENQTAGMSTGSGRTTLRGCAFIRNAPWGGDRDERLGDHPGRLRLSRQQK